MSGIFASLFDRMGPTSKPDLASELTRAGSSDSTITEVSADMSSKAQSSSSTPPTSIGDSLSISSTSSSSEQTQKTPANDYTGRSRRQRTSVDTYNVKVLSGTAIHAPRKYLKNKQESETVSRRKTISGDELANISSTSTSDHANRLLGRYKSRDVDALDLEWPVKGASTRQYSKNGPKKAGNTPESRRKRATYTSGVSASSAPQKTTVLGKRRRSVVEDKYQGFGKAKRELRNLADTNEFAKIDTQPVIHEVWSKGKLVLQTSTSAKSKRMLASKPVGSIKVKATEPVVAKALGRKKEKVWLQMGLYAGQLPEENLNWFKSWGDSRGGQELPPFKPGGPLPLPMWHGQRLLYLGRDFKLPFDVCSPLPPGQPKPDEWHRTSSNRFVGNAGALWKKSSLFDSFSSKCVCTPEGGCDEDCQNRIMLYECDDTNCASGRDRCTNRAFAQLQERRKGGGKFRIGVEVIKTTDRGYGVRSNRCFEPNQIIVEYTGEIITEDECDRRMNEDYKNNNCYYLMSFDQNMIIDATKGSIARFVNHSCRPNCRMVKWIVGGKPRMALFAGDSPIMSGDELTYDYNFDPFSAKNVQECLCGSDNCRGVLGPRPKDPKPTLKDAVKSTVKTGKRKLQQILGADAETQGSGVKKRKIIRAKGVKRRSGPKSVKRTSVAKSIKRKPAPIVKELIVSRRSSQKHSMVRANKKGLLQARKTQTSIKLKKYNRVVSSRKEKAYVVERKSPRSKARRSYREYLDNDHLEEAGKSAKPSDDKELLSLDKEESSTIRVITGVEA